MAHVAIIHAHPDTLFASQLAIQLQQRGLVIWPLPDPMRPEEDHSAESRATLDEASHVLIILPGDFSDTDELQLDCERALEAGKYLFVVQRHTGEIPAKLKACPHVDFRGQFLLAVEDLVEELKKANAPRRQLTIEHPPPVVKADLLPMALPSERCWREDRVRINYTLPMILPDDELAARLPGFYQAAGFELIERGRHSFRAQRHQQAFRLWDPRRAQHTLTVEPLEGSLRAYYQTTRTQVFFWMRAHYHTLDREAAALYRYLATEDTRNLLVHVRKQARAARVWSWLLLLVVLLVASGIVLLLLDALFNWGVI